MKHFVLLGLVSALTALVALPANPALGATYVVDTIDDDPGVTMTACTGAPGDCSLRGAITNANASGAGDVITFDPSVFNPATINIASALPTLTGGGDTIDGSGVSVTIQGAEARTFDCLVISSANNTVKGLELTDCDAAVLLSGAASGNTIGPANTIFDNQTGISVSNSASSNLIAGNKIGTNAAGDAIPPEGGNFDGIVISGLNNTVGGTTVSARNVISGNANAGIQIFQGNENFVYGNFIGTGVGGASDLGNGSGLGLVAADANVIGGTAPGQRNLISGNSNRNVLLLSGSDLNTLSGNIIGPDINGSAVGMTNGGGLIIASGSGNNTIGPYNVISANSLGIEIDGQGTTGNVVKGNRIGAGVSR